MRLLDRVAITNLPIVLLSRKNREYILPSAAALKAELHECPLRFVMQDDLTAGCAAMAYVDDKFLADCLDIIRLPSGSNGMSARAANRSRASAPSSLTSRSACW